MPSGGYTGLLAALYDFQPLAAALIAIATAYLGGKYLYKAARVPVEAAKMQAAEHRKRRLAAVGTMLASDFNRLSVLAEQSEGTIRASIGARIQMNDELRQRILLPIPQLISSWEDMSLFEVSVLRKIFEEKAKLDQFNYDVSRYRGDFGGDDVNAQLKAQLKDLRESARNTASQITITVNRADKSTTTKIVE